MADKVKVAVGQVWQHLGQGRKFKITRIDMINFIAYNENIEENIFGTIDKSGFPIWSEDWKIVEDNSTASATNSSKPLDQDMKFFRASSHAFNCDKCGAPKPCKYHNT
jgi:hypothetical protein